MGEIEVFIASGGSLGGFLMLSHRASPEELARQARIIVDSGCQCVYVVDSAGALLMQGVLDRVSALVEEIGRDAQVGFHGHQNLSLGVANSVVAYEAGARQIDGTLCALGAGPGNAPIEVLATVFELMGLPNAIDIDQLTAVAQDDVRRTFRDSLPVIDRTALIQGRFGAYNSFFLHVNRAAERYGVPAHEILKRVGERGYVGGQEDMIIDVAVELRSENSL